MTAYGINIKGILNELEGFHITEDSPPDITHDFLLELLPKRFRRVAQNVKKKDS